MGKTLEFQGHVQRTRLSDTVYEKLLESITSGKLPRGAIVSEVALSKQLDVSRTPVHDALRQLAKDGLVEQRAGRRAIITAFTKDDVFDIFEMRILLEAEAARRAAKRVDEATAKSLRAEAEELKRNADPTDWLHRWANFEDAFHDAIARSCGSPRLWHDIARYRLLHRGFNESATNIEALQSALVEHLGILEAIERRDSDSAAQRMAQHLQKWQAHFVERFS